MVEGLADAVVQWFIAAQGPIDVAVSLLMLGTALLLLQVVPGGVGLTAVFAGAALVGLELLSWLKPNAFVDHRLWLLYQAATLLYYPAVAWCAFAVWSDRRARLSSERPALGDV